MCDAKIYLSRKEAAKELSKLSVKGTVFEIGRYNGRPVMLVDSYDYWVTGKYRGVGRSARPSRSGSTLVAEYQRVCWQVCCGRDLDPAV